VPPFPGQWWDGTAQTVPALEKRLSIPPFSFSEIEAGMEADQKVLK
jgi:hypothetical protein